MKSIFSIVIDFVFVLFTTFILSLIIFARITPYPFNLIYSILFALSSCLIYYILAKRNRQKFMNGKKTQRDYARFIDQLNLCTTTEQNAVIEKALSYTGKLCERKKGAIHVINTKAVIFCKFGLQSVCKADVFKIFNRISKTQTAYVLSENFSQEVLSFAKRFDDRIILVDGQQLFKFMSENDCLPVINKNLPPEPDNKPKLNWILRKKNAKSFFVLGLGFIVTSYFVPIRIYYLTFGCLFLCFSLVLRLFGKTHGKV